MRNKRKWVCVSVSYCRRDPLAFRIHSTIIVSISHALSLSTRLLYCLCVPTHLLLIAVFSHVVSVWLQSKEMSSKQNLRLLKSMFSNGSLLFTTTTTITTAITTTTTTTTNTPLTGSPIASVPLHHLLLALRYLSLPISFLFIHVKASLLFLIVIATQFNAHVILSIFIMCPYQISCFISIRVNSICITLNSFIIKYVFQCVYFLMFWKKSVSIVLTNFLRLTDNRQHAARLQLLH